MSKRIRLGAASLALVLTAGLAACGNQRAGDDVRADQTKFPGQVSAGGGTSGEVIARGMKEPVVVGPSGTPGIPQGSEGNVGGAALGGTVPKETEIGGSGAKTPEQARKPEPAREPELSTAPPAPPGAASR